MILSDREREVLDGIMAGKLHKEIASALNISVSAAKKHAGHIYEKFGAESRHELIRLIRAEGLKLEWYKLSPLEKQIARQSREHTQEQIAEMIGKSVSFVRQKLMVIYTVLRVRGRVGLAVYMTHHGVMYEEEITTKAIQ